MKNNLMILTMLLSFSESIYADNNLPAFNSKGSTCKHVTINGLESNEKTKGLLPIDHGFELSSGCDTVFVRPPKFGEIEVDSYAESATIDLCPVYQGNIKLINVITNNQIKYESAGRFTDADQMKMRKNRVYEEMYARGQLSVVATLRVVMSLQWNELVKAYSENNPDLTVVKLPVYHSLMASSLVDLRGSSPVEEQLPPLIYSYIPDYTENLDNDGPLGSKTYGYEFDGSKGAQIGLSYTGICKFYDPKTGFINEDSLYKLTTHLVSNVTYFYPVKVSYGYRANISTEAFVSALNKFAEQKPKIGGAIYITHEEYMSVIKQLQSSGNIEVKLSDSANRNYSAAEVNSIEQAVFDQYVNFIIGHISETSTGKETDGSVNFKGRTYKINLANVNDKISKVSTFFTKGMEHTQELLLAGSFTFKAKNKPKENK